LDSAALACGVAALEHDDVPSAVLLLHFCSFSSSIWVSASVVALIASSWEGPTHDEL
jgi:hypothetical protein